MKQRRKDMVKREMEVAKLETEEELGIIASPPPMNFNAKSLSFPPASIRNSRKQGGGLHSHAAVCFLLLLLMVCWAAGCVFGCLLIIKHDEQLPILGRNTCLCVYRNECPFEASH